MATFDKLFSRCHKPFSVHFHHWMFCQGPAPRQQSVDAGPRIMTVVTMTTMIKSHLDFAINLSRLAYLMTRLRLRRLHLLTSRYHRKLSCQIFNNLKVILKIKKCFPPTTYSKSKSFVFFNLTQPGPKMSLLVWTFQLNGWYQKW